MPRREAVCAVSNIMVIGFNCAGGLAAIRARAQTYKRSCEVAGVRNAGTTVTVSLPLP